MIRSHSVDDDDHEDNTTHLRRLLAEKSNGDISQCRVNQYTLRNIGIAGWDLSLFRRDVGSPVGKRFRSWRSVAFAEESL